MKPDLFPRLELFLNELSANNHKLWFDEHRQLYQGIRGDFIRFVDELLASVVLLDEDLAGQEGKNCIFRINRDVRFSQNKAPYKNNFSAYLSKGGKKFPGAGYYFHFQPGNSFLAAGVWMPEATLLKSIRQEIDYDVEAFSLICTDLDSRGYRLEGERLSRPPKGYEANNPAIEWIKLKSFVFTRPFELSGIKDPKDIIADFTHAVRDLKPFVNFLNRVFDQGN
ncbi:MAG: DUF2461 domain-containing protein [Bacteroidia bacterium]